MRPTTLLILTAVMTEARAIAKAAGVPCPKPNQPAQWNRQDLRVTLALVGISARQLPTDAADTVIMAGLAGALDPSLAIGDLIIDDWPEGIPLPATAKRGAIHTAQDLAATPAQKADLFAQTHAAAVDMENAAVRQWALRHGAAFGAVRAISDRADQALDPAFLTFIDQWGRPRPGRILSALVSRPSLLPALLRLGSDSKNAAGRLGDVFI
jgi:adenosylhomocysteine nucleosidase